MSDLLVSIIIPVYNAEAYLAGCIESVQNQTYRSIEILLIDDGSIDSSGAICDKYAKSDNRIKVIHKENGGVSVARNLGIECSQGDFLVFVDSDDTISAECIEYMLNLQKEHNCKYCGQLNNSSGFCHEGSIDLIKDKEVFLKYISFDAYALHGKLYSAEVIKNANLRFDESMTCSEDADFNRRFFMECDKIYLFAKKVYHYNRSDRVSLSGRGHINFADYYVKKLELLKKISDKISAGYELFESFVSERAIHGLRLSALHYFTFFENSSNQRELVKKAYTLILPYIGSVGGYDMLRTDDKMWYIANKDIIHSRDFDKFYDMMKRCYMLKKIKRRLRRFVKKIIRRK